MPVKRKVMARGSHHSSGSHHGSHHSSHSSHHSSSHRSYHRSTGYHSHKSPNFHSHRGAYNNLENPLRMAPSGVESYHGTWMFGKDYFINTNDEYYKNHFDEDKIPWPVRCSGVFDVVLILAMFGTFLNLFYELLIPFFENISMTDGAFYAADQLIYFGQWLLPVLLISWKGWAVRRADQMERAFCLEMIQYYQAMKQKDEYEFKKKEHQASLRYYKECPNCGAPVGENDTVCAYCDSSLLIPEARTWVVPDDIPASALVEGQEQDNLSQSPQEWMK